jgi:hypothetical protein
VDVPGAVLLSGALVSLMVALTEGEGWGWTSPQVLAVAGTSAALFVLWGVVESRVASPMVDLRMLAHRPVLLTNLATLAAGFALFSCFVLLPVFVQTESRYGYGFGATDWPLAGGMAIVCVAAVIFATAHEDPLPVLVASALLGFGVGAAFAAMAALIADSVDAREMGVAGGMNTVVRMIGAVVGGQVGAALLTAQTIGRSDVPAESAFTTTFTLSAVMALVAAGIALTIRRVAPHRLRAAAR